MRSRREQRSMPARKQKVSFNYVLVERPAGSPRRDLLRFSTEKEYRAEFMRECRRHGKRRVKAGRYCGKTGNYQRRFAGYKRGDEGSNRGVLEALEKNGGEWPFEMIIIKRASPQAALVGERRIVVEIHGGPDGTMNANSGGGRDTELSDEARARMSNKAHESWSDPVVRERRLAGARTQQARRRRSEGGKAAWQRRGARKRRLAAVAEVRARPGYGERLSKGIKEAWAKPEVRAKFASTNKQPKVKARRSESATKAMSKKSVRRKISESQKRAWAKSEVRRKASNSARDRWNKPGEKSRRAQMSKDIWNRPGYRERMYATNSRPCVKRRRSEGARRAWSRPEVQNKVKKGMREAWAKPGSREKWGKAISEGIRAAQAEFGISENRRTYTDTEILQWCRQYAAGRTWGEVGELHGMSGPQICTIIRRRKNRGLTISKKLEARMNSRKGEAHRDHTNDDYCRWLQHRLDGLTWEDAAEKEGMTAGGLRNTLIYAIEHGWVKVSARRASTLREPLRSMAQGKRPRGGWKGGK